MTTQALLLRPVAPDDYAHWRPLWDQYNAFYGRSGPTALDERITAQTWSWFFDAKTGVHAYVAELDGKVVGIVHYLFHRSTTRLSDVCYLQDLFTDAACRGRGVGRALIQQVLNAAKEHGTTRVYWNTYEDNATARMLYDKMAKYLGSIVYTHEL